MIPDNDHNRPRLHTAKQAAIFIGCSERKLRSKIKVGTITYWRPPEGRRFAEEGFLDRLRPKSGTGAQKGFKDPLQERLFWQSSAPTSHTGNIVNDVTGSTPACALSMIIVGGFRKPKSPIPGQRGAKSSTDDVAHFGMPKCSAAIQNYFKNVAYQTLNQAHEHTNHHS